MITTYALTKIEGAEDFLKHLANRYSVCDTSSGKSIDVGLTDGNTLAMAHAKIVVVRAEPANVRVICRASRKIAGRAGRQKDSNHSHQTDGCTQNQFIHRNLLKISICI
jgi:hypothetical protein